MIASYMGYVHALPIAAGFDDASLMSLKLRVAVKFVVAALNWAPINRAGASRAWCSPLPTV